MVIALLIAAGPVFAPREGRAGPARGQYLPGDPRPTQEMGGPEVPPLPGPLVSCRVWLSSVLLARGLQVNLAIMVGAPKRSSDTRLVRYALRTVVNP